MPAHGLRPGDFDARQGPVGCAQRLVSFQAKLDGLPAGHRLAVNQPQLGVGLVRRLAQEVIAQARCVESGDDVAFGHAKDQLAQRRFADVQLDVRVNHQLVIAEVIVHNLGYAQLRQDLVGLNSQGKISAGKPIGELLAGRRAEERFVPLRKLVG